MAAAPALITPALIADPRIADDQTLLADDQVTFSGVSPATDTASATPMVIDEQEIECMAKVVRHEAGNQSRKGQLAVAQIMMNRLRSGSFSSTLCGIANQRGQFFDLASYNPRRDTPQWESAMSVSREVMTGTADDVTNGAYFFRAAYAPPTRFFQSRRQVQTVGDHIFYR